MLAAATVRDWSPRVSQSIRDVSRLLPAPFSSNPCLVLPVFGAYACTLQGIKRWEDGLSSPLIPHTELCIQSDRLYWVSQNPPGVFTAGLSEGFHWWFPNQGSPGWELPSAEEHCSYSIHPSIQPAMGYLRTEAAAFSGLFPWIIPRLIPRH